MYPNPPPWLGTEQLSAIRLGKTPMPMTKSRGQSSSRRSSSRRYDAPAPISRATHSLASSRMSVRTTLAPSRPNARAIPSPIPRAAPVTTATFPSSLDIGSSVGGGSGQASVVILPTDERGIFPTPHDTFGT